MPTIATTETALPATAVPDVPPSADDPRLDAWRAFLEAHTRVTRRLDEELRSEHGLSLAEYDALLQLARSPGHRLRMNQLADRVILSRSGITRLIDRLEADGLVERAHCPSDARGAEAVLTDSGLARLRAASHTHLRGVETHFLAVASADDLDAVRRALGEVAARACGGHGPAMTDCPPAAEDGRTA